MSVPAFEEAFEKVSKLAATFQANEARYLSPEYQEAEARKDFIITRKKVPLGHIETKDIGTNLDEMERGKGPNGEQFVRYRDGLPFSEAKVEEVAKAGRKRRDRVFFHRKSWHVVVPKIRLSRVLVKALG